jgi:hypothetical protein
MSWAADDPRRIDRANALRLAAANGEPEVNGIVSAEVVEAGGNIDIVLTLVFNAALAGPRRILPADVIISGGVRRPNIPVESVTAAGRRLTLRVGRRGDFSIYTLELRRAGAPPPRFDALLSAIPIGFRLECDQPFDCEAPAPAEAADLERVPIDYLARDYAGFRELMMARFKALVPGWTDPGPASPEVTLIEMLAHVVDRLSYAQDAVATEAYLDTARLRVSAKRHARLVDYRMHDGANARSFVHVALRRPGPSEAPVAATINPGGRFLTRTAGVAPASAETPLAIEARVNGALVFEAVTGAALSSSHNRILIHDFLGSLTEIPAGATSMTVTDPGRLIALAPGDFLLIEEVLEAVSVTGSNIMVGNASPDPLRRHVVRLTGVAQGNDPIGQRDGGGIPRPLDTLLLSWDSADAPRSALPMARVTSGDEVDGIPAGSTDQPTLIARGNIVLADHGETKGLDAPFATVKPGRRRAHMKLSAGPVTWRRAFDGASSAAAALDPPVTGARPAIRVRQEVGAGGNPVWQVVEELLASDGDDQQLVLDIEHGGAASLRTGDGLSGRLPDPAVAMTARYRIGNGIEGNVGAEAIGHLLTDNYTGLNGSLLQGFTGQPSDVAAVRNPLAAVGGVAAETIAEVRVKAPIGFRTQERAVVHEDYFAFLRRDPLVANAKAIEQWTGSWRAIVLLVDLVGGGPIDAATEERFRARLEPVRLAGHVLEFRSPALVPLEIGMRVCVAADAETDAVLERLMALFSSGRQADGSPGLFHPDRFSFGDSLHLSALYAAAQSVEGVRHVDITTLRRQGVPGDSASALDAGGLDFGVYEIPVIANDPNFPDRGVVRFAMEGGR